MTDLKEQIAIALWHRFAPEWHVDWSEEEYQAEYRDAADAVLLLAQPSAAPVEPHDPSQYCDLDACKREGCTHLADACLSRQKTAAPIEREPIVCDKCNEVMIAGSEGEPFMMLSCREAKQCLHNIPGCICDGDPTNG